MAKKHIGRRSGKKDTTALCLKRVYRASRLGNSSLPSSGVCSDKRCIIR
jgi:hypothetical protein